MIMTLKKPQFYLTLTASTLTICLLSCQPSTATDKVNNTTLTDFPPIILWAWERPEDLRFLNTDKVGVAFLAQTLTLTGNEINTKPRPQPLNVTPQTTLIAVTRIETGTAPVL